MDNHALFVFKRVDGETRVRSLCGRWEMPLGEALGERTINMPIAEDDDAFECEHCRAAAARERAAFGGWTAVDPMTCSPEELLDDVIRTSIVVEARRDSHEAPRSRIYTASALHRLGTYSAGTPLQIVTVGDGPVDLFGFRGRGGGSGASA